MVEKSLHREHFVGQAAKRILWKLFRELLQGFLPKEVFKERSAEGAAEARTKDPERLLSMNRQCVDSLYDRQGRGKALSLPTPVVYRKAIDGSPKTAAEFRTTTSAASLRRATARRRHALSGCRAPNDSLV
jgi:hypothetical protein